MEVMSDFEMFSQAFLFLYLFYSIVYFVGFGSEIFRSINQCYTFTLFAGIGGKRGMEQVGM